MYLVKWSTKITKYFKPSIESTGEVQTSEKIISRGALDIRDEFENGSL